MSVGVRNRQRLLKVDPRLLSAVAAHALELVGAPNDSLDIVLVSDREIARLNEKFHNTKGATDVLSFDYGQGRGELIVSAERARAHARRFRTTPARELVLYVLHGILHLHGYDDVTLRARRRMRAAERRWMKALAESFTLAKVVRS